jgi:hypothetical protein
MCNEMMELVVKYTPFNSCRKNPHRTQNYLNFNKSIRDQTNLLNNSITKASHVRSEEHQLYGSVWQYFQIGSSNAFCHFPHFTCPTIMEVQHCVIGSYWTLAKLPPSPHISHTWQCDHSLQRHLTHKPQPILYLKWYAHNTPTWLKCPYTCICIQYSHKSWRALCHTFLFHLFK